MRPSPDTVNAVARRASSRWIQLAVWLLGRGIVVALIFGIADGDVAQLQDVAFYLESARHVAELGYMPSTELWQYPPGALLVMLPPLVLGTGMAYAAGFVALMLACDAAITWLLARAARAGGSLLGLWGWLLVVPFLREFSLLRFDLLPTLLAVVALTLLLRRPVLMGAVLGLGALVKAWPVVLVAAQWRMRSLLAATVAAAFVIVLGVALASGLLGDQGAVLDNQSERGLQQEAIAATWWHAEAVATGADAPLAYEFGSIQIADPAASDVVAGLLIATVVAAGLLGALWLRRRSDAPARQLDFVFVGVLVLITLSRVFSPQFMLWALAVGAVAVSRPQSRMRRPFVLLCASALLVVGILNVPALLVLRNVLFVVAVADAVQRLVRQAPERADLPGRSTYAATSNAAPTSR